MTASTPTPTPAPAATTEPAQTPSFVERRRNLIIRLVGLVVSVAALWFVVRSVDLAKCADVISHANPIPLAACLLVVSTQVVLRSLRWRMLLPQPRNGGRLRKTAIVALARKLLVALWKYVTAGVVIEGAIITTA